MNRQLFIYLNDYGYTNYVIVDLIYLCLLRKRNISRRSLKFNLLKDEKLNNRNLTYVIQLCNDL